MPLITSPGLEKRNRQVGAMVLAQVNRALTPHHCARGISVGRKEEEEWKRTRSRSTARQGWRC